MKTKETIAHRRAMKKVLHENKFVGITLDSGEKPTAMKAVFRTANILNCLSEGIGSVTEIAALCQLNKSKIHILLTAMCEAKMVALDPISHQYCIGPLIHKIATSVDITHELLVSCAANELETLAELTGESIGLGVLIGLHGVSIYEIPSDYDHKVVGRTKVISQIHAGAGPKVYLSELPQNELKIYLATRELKPMTENTITDKDELVAQLNQIRRNGYAISYGERIPDAMDIAAPIKGYPIPATVVILGPQSRMKPKKEEYLRALLMSTAKIEENLRQFSI
jgi:IclR family transcriptional regulator, KDG regulon repressor